VGVEGCGIYEPAAEAGRCLYASEHPSSLLVRVAGGRRPPLRTAVQDRI